MSDELVKFLSARLDEDAEYAGWYDEQADYEGPQLLGATGSDAGWGDFKARVLREVAAKRQLLATANEAYYAADHYAYEQITRALAAIWSDHPDYRQEWKP